MTEIIKNPTCFIDKGYLQCSELQIFEDKIVAIDYETFDLYCISTHQLEVLNEDCSIHMGFWLIDGWFNMKMRKDGNNFEFLSIFRRDGYPTTLIDREIIKYFRNLKEEAMNWHRNRMKVLSERNSI